MNLKALLYAAEAIPTLMDKIEPAKSTMRSRNFYALDRYMESVHTINESLQIMSSLYYPYSMKAVSNNMRYSVYSSQDIFMAMDAEDENIFLNLYKDHTLSSILEASPNLIGISITNTSQIIPGLTLAKLIKDQNKQIHITVGGSVFYKTHRKYNKARQTLLDS